MTLDKPLDKILFFDIETVSEFESLNELKKQKPKLYKVFLDYIDFFKSRFLRVKYRHLQGTFV